MYRKIKFFTNKDYEILNPYDAIIYDKRNFFELLFTFLIEENVLINLLFCESILEPLWLRLVFFYFDLSINFAMSALFFSDDYIDERSTVPADLRVF